MPELLKDEQKIAWCRRCRHHEKRKEKEKKRGSGEEIADQSASKKKEAVMMIECPRVRVFIPAREPVTDCHSHHSLHASPSVRKMCRRPARYREG